MKIKDSSGGVSYETAGVASCDGEQWEYLVRVMPLRNADLMGAFGADGWELVSVTPDHPNPSNGVFHFKRRMR